MTETRVRAGERGLSKRTGKDTQGYTTEEGEKIKSDHRVGWRCEDIGEQNM